MLLKNTSVAIKAGPDDGLPDGTFTAYASVFGNKDSYGDVVMPGAFADTLTDWAKTGAFLPVLFGHNMSDPDYNIGHVTDATEDDHGLLVTAQLDLESPKGLQTYRLLKGRRVNQMSFAYDVVEGAWIDKTDDGAQDSFYELRKLKLYEVSVVTIGANQETEILAVKSATDAARHLATALKEGRELATKHLDALRTARDVIGAVIDAAHPDQAKASVADPASGQPPSSGPSEPSRDPSVDALSIELELLALG